MPWHMQIDEYGDKFKVDEDVYVTKEKMIEYLGERYQTIKRKYTNHPRFDKDDWRWREAHIAQLLDEFHKHNPRKESRIDAFFTSKEKEVFWQVVEDLYDELPDMKPEDKDPKTREQYEFKYPGAPTLAEGAFVAIFCSVLVFCATERVGLWIVIWSYYCFWAYLEIRKYNSIYFKDQQRKRDKERKERKNGKNKK